jgi:hypothetical protein
VVEKTPTQLGPLEKANLNPSGAQLSRCLLPHLHLMTETDPVSEMSCSLEYQTMEKVQNPYNSVGSTCIRISKPLELESVGKHSDVRKWQEYRVRKGKS